MVVAVDPRFGPSCPKEVVVFQGPRMLYDQGRRPDPGRSSAHPISPLSPPMSDVTPTQSP